MARRFHACLCGSGIDIRRLRVVLAAVCALSVTLMARDSMPAQSVLSPATQTAIAQNPSQITVLEPGKTIEREAVRGSSDIFQITLSQGQYASVAIDHRGLDFSMRLLDSQGTVKVEGESNAGGDREIFEFIAEKSGAYQIQLAPKYPKSPAGKYQVRIGEVRTASDKDRALYDARRQYSESLKLYQAGAYDKAQTLAERALDLREAALGPGYPDVAASLQLVGVICTARSDYDRAEKLFQQALAINEKAFGSDHPAVAEAIDNLAKNYNAKGNYAEAERFARMALGMREKALGADHFVVAASLGTLGDVFLAKGDYASARVFSERALEIAGKSYAQEDLPYTDASSRLARVQMRQGAFASAEELFIRALHTRETITGKDSLQAADSLHDLSLLYVLKNDNVKSEQMSLKALPLKEKILGPNHLQISLLLHNLGLVYYRRGDYSTAETYYLRALAIKEKTLGPSHPLLVATVNNLGLMYWKQGDNTRAAEFFRRALEICDKAYGPDSTDATFPLSNLGIIAKETGDYDRAEMYYKRALEINEKALGPQSPRLVVTIESLGILYRDKGDYAKAESWFLRAAALTKASLGPDHPDNVRHFINLAQLYAAKGDLASALKSFERSSEIEEKNLPLNLTVGSERQKLAYFVPMADNLERIISFQVQQDSGDKEALNLAVTTLLQRKGRVLDVMADSLGTLWNRSNAEDRSLLDRLKDVTSQLAALVLKGPQGLSISEHQERVKALTLRREQLENEVGRRNAGYYERAGTVNLNAVKAAIPADAALVEFAVYHPFDPKQANESTNRWGHPRYVAYVVPGRGDVRWKDLGPAKDIDDEVAAFRQALRDPQRKDIKQLARALDERIMEPLRALTGKATHLLVSPDGQLDLIPFEALVDSRGRYLVEDSSVTYLTTGRDLLRMEVARESKSGPLVIADPVFGEPGTTIVAKADKPGLQHVAAVNRRRSTTTAKDFAEVYFAPLSGTAQEARAIQSLFPEARVLTREQATKSALKRVDAPSILHIATHGFFLQDTAEGTSPEGALPATRQRIGSDNRSPQPGGGIGNPLLRSGLALAGANLNRGKSEDGILTALEASNLDLWGTKLVVLSACETGVGEVRDGEGVYGLRRSFFLAGSETLVMSLWSVSDQVTRQTMTAYYAGLKQGLGRGEALHRAQLAMLKRKGSEHPYYWASFIQSGDWTGLHGKPAH